MDYLTPILGAGASIASALIGSSSKDKSLAGSYIMPDGDRVGFENGRLIRNNPDGTTKDLMDSTVFGKIPKSVYWSLMANQANQMFAEKCGMSKMSTIHLLIRLNV